MPERTTGAEPITDVRAQHQAALAHLKAAQDRVRALNGALVSERIELVDSRRAMKRLRPDGTEAGPGERNTWGIVVSNEVVGSKWVPVETDPIQRWRARLDYPQAVEALRRAELDELEWRAQVVELDRQEAQRRKLALLPKVAAAYAKLDKALIAAARERQGVLDALAELGAVSPVDAAMSMNFAWPELGLLDHRRQQVKAWTSQGNGHGTA